MRARIFVIGVVVQYCAFFGLIADGIYQSDTFDRRLLLLITLLGVTCCLSTLALFANDRGKW
jgi:hypothetical protein